MNAPEEEMLSSSPKDIARRAARRLAKLDRRIPLAVEEQFQAGTSSERFEPVTLAVAVAGLLLSAVKAAWDIRRDMAASAASKEKAKERAALRRCLQLALQAPDIISPELRNAVIEAVVEEMPEAE